VNRSENSKPSVGIIGLGHVGQNIQHRVESTFDVVAYDVAWEVLYPSSELEQCDLVIVCVPTPSLPNGECDTTIVEKAVASLPVDLVWVRSTVPPGTCDLLSERYRKQICFSPEYVGETNFSEGYDLEKFLVVGGEPDARRQIVDFAMRCDDAPERVYQCSNAEAELVKYMENSFLATKVGLVAEFYELSRKLDLDWYAVREAWLADPRIGRAHSHALPHDLGFGGKCLPKDVAALCAFADSAGSPLGVLEAVRDTNRNRRSDIA
jgi:UDPglucose 6-dehydrogenase